MKSSIIPGLALAASLVAVPAHADDWTGFHVGVGLGGAHGSTDLSTQADVNGLGELYTYDVGEVATGEQTYFAGNAAAAANTGKTSFFGTIEGGFDYQMGDSFVVGAFANYDFASKEDQTVSGGGAWEAGGREGPLNAAETAIDASSPDYYTYRWDNGASAISAAARIKDSWALGARAGWLANPSTLIYVAGGYTEAKINLDASAELLPSNNSVYYGPYTPSILADAETLTGSVSANTWKDGYFLGGGVETLLGSNVSAKVEYRYADYGSYSASNGDTFSVYDIDGAVTGGVSADKLRNQSVRLVLSYRM